MSEQPLHRHYLHYSELPYSQRVLYTAALLVLGTQGRTGVSRLVFGSVAMRVVCEALCPVVVVRAAA